MACVCSQDVPLRRSAFRASARFLFPGDWPRRLYLEFCCFVFFGLRTTCIERIIQQHTIEARIANFADTTFFRRNVACVTFEWFIFEDVGFGSIASRASDLASRCKEHLLFANCGIFLVLTGSTPVQFGFFHLLVIPPYQKITVEVGCCQSKIHPRIGGWIS